MLLFCGQYRENASGHTCIKKHRHENRCVPMRKACPVGKMLCLTRKNFATLGEKRDNSVRDRVRMTGERQPFVQTEQKVQNDLTNL